MWRVRSKERKCLVPAGSILSEEMESTGRRAVVMWKRRISQAAQNSATLKAVTNQLPVRAQQTQTGRLPFRFPIAARGQRGHLLRREWSQEKVRGDGKDLNMSNL